ncbi:MAG: penicillin-binding protein 2 [Clostridia bacterium]|nr:penicillin-binding protein 2 [Clostridia bacterium]
MKERIKDRYNILAVCFIILGLVIVFKLVNLQIINGEYYDEVSQERLFNLRKITAARGNIVDRNGIPLANNRMGFTVQIVYAGIKGDELNDMLMKLIRVFEKNNDTYNKNFTKYITFNPIGFGDSAKKAKSPIEKIKKDLLLKVKNDDKLDTAEDVFKYLRDKKYKIDKKYTDEEAYKIMAMRYELLHFSSLNPTLLARDVSKVTVAELEERHHEFPGVTTDIEPVRKYNDAQYAAHILGYIGKISDKSYENLKSKGYTMNDLIGKDGIELAAEEDLKGIDGQRRVEVNTEGRFTEELNSNPAKPGNNVVLTIDMNLQKVAAESLERTIKAIRERKPGKTHKNNKGDALAGAVVAIDVNNGEVLAMASYPNYNPSVFLERSDNKEAQKQITALFTDGTNSPTMNRAIATAYPPGSTFKPLVGIAGLQEGVISRETKIQDTGFFYEEGVKLTCLEYANGMLRSGHGFVNLKDALATSCNIFFYKLGISMGIDKIDKWGKMFGLGEYTGIELSGEVEGIRSNLEYHKKQSDNKWGRVYTAKSAIGQQYNTYTPLQLASYTATIANGGEKYTPHIIKRVVSYDGTVVRENAQKPVQLPVSKETIAAVKEGMEAVTQHSSEGTAATVFESFYTNYGIRVAGKTGTAETYDSIKKGKSNNGMFICYAPADNPKIAVAVAIERGVFGYYTADVARDILAEYFNVNNKGTVDSTVKPDEVIFTW